MSIFVTSDLHLGHKKIINHCDRPFESVDHMNKVIVNNWNKTIRPRDTVYFLGDLSRYLLLTFLFFDLLLQFPSISPFF